MTAIMITADTIGLLSGALTTAAFVPQVRKVWRTRSAADISMSMYAVFTAGLAGWLIYGAIIASWPIILANGITIVLAGSVIAMKLRFDRAGTPKK